MSYRQSQLRVWGIVIIVGTLVAGLAHADTRSAPPSIELSKAVHFLTPTGEDVMVGPGTYEVEAVKEGLRLKPKDGKDSEAVVVQAMPIPHGESLTAPKTQSEPGIGPDEHRIALLLPDNQGLESRGSYSGIRSRGVCGTCTAYGASALLSNTTGINNVAMGGAALTSNTTGSNNTAMGLRSLWLNTTGGGNTAVGFEALKFNTLGPHNTALGEYALHKNTAMGNTATGSMALYSNTTGSSNTATGYIALYSNTVGSYNTAIGDRALYFTTSGGNTALGAYALYQNTTGTNNVALGTQALTANTTGSNNIAIGQWAGGLTTTGSRNIYISSGGPAEESGTIRLGTQNAQTRAFIAGISGVAVSGVPVVVDANGQLGIAPSSLRYKTDIRELSTTSDALLKLRPVSFRYRPDAVAGAEARPVQYGLIAEEVAEVLPDLVTRNASGEVLTVRYDQLVPLLLNELQKQHRKIEALSAEVAVLKAK